MDGYYAFFIVATALVLMMTTPALALFYGGMSRSKSVLNMMMMSFTAMGLIGIIYVLWGWSMSGLDDANGFGNGKLIGAVFKGFGLNGETWSVDDPTGTGSTYLWVAFQLTFAVITAALISGAIADRVKLSAWLVFIGIWVTLCYFPVAHNVWGGGWLVGKWAALDYAGGTVVHINAGIAGLVLALVIGKRVGFMSDAMKPHSLPLTMIGAGLLWFGWYGFNVGSIVFYNGTVDDSGKDIGATQFMSETGATFLNTTLATMAAMLAWLVVERLVHGKASALGAASGIVAGLVAITPSCGAVDIWGALIIGVVAGGLCAVAVGLKYRLKFDDSLDVVGVHLVGGVVGALMIGLVGTKGAPQGLDGLFYGGGLDLLGTQFMAVLFTIVWTGVLTTIIALAIKYTIGWRVTAEAEVEGIDGDQHGETAYDIAAGTGVLS
ncbi:ammonium transporter [Nocardioides sp. Kera G14]|uniref:ammonium transporter n=1 Tax=Nocardioides sp. Kera G14 TaxID=2884264 RepID=UPI001D100D90|nr:ammonium transporter [Nocardioides sp. Kera G14]UDY22657.1 ammonium transporter [Nocardioides sp. Kera G14]